MRRTHLISLILTLMTWAIAWAGVEPRFYAVDDMVMQCTMSGNSFADPSGYAAFTNIALGELIATLFRLAPLIPWWFVWLVAGMLAAMYAWIFCVVKLIRPKLEGYELGVHAAAFVLLLLGSSVLFSNALAQPTMTFTASVMASAAIPLFWLHIRSGCEGAGSDTMGAVRQHVLYAVASCLLMLGGLCTREDAALAALPFYVGVGVLGILVAQETGEMARADARKRRLLWAGIPVAVSILLLVGCHLLQQVAYAGPEWQEFTEVNVARSDYCDYPHVEYDDDPELYQSVGWTRTVSDCVSSWLFFDERVTASSFEALSLPMEQQGMTASLVELGITLRDMPSGLVICLLAAAGVLAIGVVTYSRNGMYALFAAMCWGVAMVELLALSMKGRLLERTAFVSVLPLVTALVGPLLTVLVEASETNKAEVGIPERNVVLAKVLRFATVLVSIATTLVSLRYAMSGRGALWAVFAGVAGGMSLAAILPLRKRRGSFSVYVLTVAVLLASSVLVLKREGRASTQGYRESRPITQGVIDYVAAHPETSYYTIGGSISYTFDPAVMRMPKNMLPLGGWQFYLPQVKQHFLLDCGRPMTYAERLVQDDVRVIVGGEGGALLIASAVEETSGVSTHVELDETIPGACVYRISQETPGRA